jgi:hypothetical protein
MDLRQIKEISESESRTYWCPAPVLLNVGGCAASAWKVGVYVWQAFQTVSVRAGGSK